MKKFLALLLAALMILSTFVSCGKEEETNTESGTENNHDANISNAVISYDNEQTKTIEDSIISSENSTDGKKITVKKGSPLDSLAVNDIFMLEGDEESEFGSLYFGKITDIQATEENTTYTLETPMMDEVFTELDLDFTQDLTFDNIVSIDAFEGVTVTEGDDGGASGELGTSVREKSFSLQRASSSNTSNSLGITPSYDNSTRTVKIEYEIDLMKYFNASSDSSSNLNSPLTEDEAKKTEVFYTDTGICYHRGTCRCLYKSKHSTTVYDAINSLELRACKVCNPPIRAFNDNDWFTTKSTLTLKGQASISNMSVSVLSENGKTWDWDEGFDNLKIRTSGNLSANAKLEGNFKANLGGKETSASIANDWITAYGLKEKTFPLALVKLKPSGTVSFSKGASSYDNTSALTVGVLIYADINGNISAATTMECSYKKDLSHDFTIFENREFKGLKAESNSGDGVFDWSVKAEMSADVDFDILGCSVMIFVGNVNIMELALFRVGVEVDGNMNLSASPNQKKFEVNGSVCGYVEALELSFRIKAKGKYFLDEELGSDKPFGPLFRKDFFEWFGRFTTDSESGDDNDEIVIEPNTLRYSLSDDGSYYSVVGIGTCTDANITIPAKYKDKPVKRIGGSAFSYCENVKSITMGDGIEDIGMYAFAFCPNLETVKLSNSITEIDSCTFSECTSLKEIDIPDGVDYIGDGAFYKCTSLENIELPKGIDRINEYAFCECESLKEVIIPDGVKEICEHAFFHCYALETVVIPEGVTLIDFNAFKECYELKNINIPNSIETIDYGAFVRSNAINFNTYDNGLYIGNSDNPYLYLWGTSSRDITYIEIHEDTKFIGSVAFWGCSKLSNVTIPTGVSIIEDRAFQKCSSLKSITIPDSVTRIGGRAFLDCTSLESVTIGNNVTEIAEYVFHNCTKLKEITIPSKVEWIYDHLFLNCSALTDIFFLGSVDQWQNITKGKDWNYNTGAYTIHCTDVDIPKS